MKLKLSVIIPAYNEEMNLKKGSLESVYEYLKKQNYSFEVIIVDDGSKDKTAEMIEQIIFPMKNFRLIRNPHGGKAVTVMTGLLKSTGEIGLFTDMDQATPIQEVEKILPKFDLGYDIVIGSRNGRVGAPVVRKIISLGFTIMRNIILGLPFSDTQCGFKAFDRKSIELVFPNLLARWEKMKTSNAAVNAGFDIETLFIAKSRHLKIAEVGVIWHYVGSERVHPIKDAIETILDMLRIRLNNLKGVYH